MKDNNYMLNQFLSRFIKLYQPLCLNMKMNKQLVYSEIEELLIRKTRECEDLSEQNQILSRDLEEKEKEVKNLRNKCLEALLKLEKSERKNRVITTDFAHGNGCMFYKGRLLTDEAYTKYLKILVKKERSRELVEPTPDEFRTNIPVLDKIGPYKICYSYPNYLSLEFYKISYCGFKVILDKDQVLKCVRKYEEKTNKKNKVRKNEL